MIEKKNNPGEVYAMKTMEKETLIDEDMLDSVKLENEILQQGDHPFLMGTHYVFQTDNKVMFVMPFAIGGELFELKRRKLQFTEEETLFYIVQIVIVLGYLHDSNVLYRDLKLENVLIGSDGYVMLADFGLAKRLEGKMELTKTFCGTPDYMAPEIVNRVFKKDTSHGLAVDWWAVGVMTYEMIMG